MIKDITLTRAGSGLLARAAAGNVVFTHAQIGKGVLAAAADISGVKQMIDPVADMQLESSGQADGNWRLRCCFTNAKPDGSFIAPFRWTEFGVFARLDADGDEVLMAYANTRDPQAGDLIPDSLCEFDIALELAFSGQHDISFRAEGVSFATHTELAAEASRVDAEFARVDGALANRALAAHKHAASDLKAGTFVGRFMADPTAARTLDAFQIRNIIISDKAPASGAHDGDVWLQYSV